MKKKKKKKEGEKEEEEKYEKKITKKQKDNEDQSFNQFNSISPDPSKPGHTVSKWGSFVRGFDKFDNKFFRISPREAAMMDPQQRILLEVTYCIKSWQ